MLLRLTVGMLAAFSLAACAPQPDKVMGTYVSPATYSGYSCKQLITERNAVVAKVNELNGAQKTKANNDGAAMAVGLVLFWPALFFLGNRNDMSPQLATMKGTYDAMTAAGVAKHCFLAPPTAAPPIAAAAPPA